MQDGGGGGGGAEYHIIINTRGTKDIERHCK